MKIRGLMMDPITNMPIVILKEATGANILPIWVGFMRQTPFNLKLRRSSLPGR